MQITHAEARRLIQFNADDALDKREKITLSTHLKDCNECRAYAEEIKEVESILLPAMRRQWNLQPIPLFMDTIHVKRNTKTQTSIILATRTAVMGVVFLAFIFSVWQFTLSGRQNPTPLPVSIPPVPTPSTQSTSTKAMLQNCEGMMYVVQENDTLESIAYQFATSKEDILAANNMKAETVRMAMEIIIPVCNFTPTGTLNPTTSLATTYTPSVSPTTFTPDG
jgi:hypothetical protein